MIKESVSIYGDKHSCLTSNGLSPASNYGHYEYSIEIPSLYYLDPLGERLRRIGFLNNITRIQAEIEKNARK